ncbi:MAG: hypothetical protein E6J18_10470 [Chloroflexi bacterium]|nr:MAG: hypothetical protein E6J18_10470 [Chloroflexota bacterium]
MVWNAAIFHDTVACVPHWLCTSSICVASYTPLMSAWLCAHASASAPRMGPDVITGEQTRSLDLASEIDLAISCTSLGPRPGQKYGRMRVASARVTQGEVKCPEAATTGRCHSSSKLRS